MALTYFKENPHKTLRFSYILSLYEYQVYIFYVIFIYDGSFFQKEILLGDAYAQFLEYFYEYSRMI